MSVTVTTTYTTETRHQAPTKKNAAGTALRTEPALQLQAIEAHLIGVVTIAKEEPKRFCPGRTDAPS